MVSNTTRTTMSPDPISAVDQPSISPREATPIVAGQPSEILETEQEQEDYPTGSKLWLNMTALAVCVFLRGFDLTIVSVVIPSLTNEFKTVSDIGWYSAAYSMVTSASILFFGKMFTLFNNKKMFLTSIAIFFIGSIVCTFANSSKLFIFGRALCGVGSACQSAGLMASTAKSFPLHKRGTIFGLFNFIQTAAMILSPPIGGLFITYFSWRACFGVNIPLLFLAFIFSCYGYEAEDSENLPLKQKIKKLDLPGTILAMPAIVCLLLALQWGGLRYGWNDARIISLLVVSITLLICFAILQYRQKDNATIPGKLLHRNLIAGSWFMACCNATLAITETYLSIYFQGVRGMTAAKAGLLAIPMIAGLGVSVLSSGWAIGKIGYYTPFLFFTSFLAPIATGVLSTLSLETSLAKPAVLLGLLGVAIGAGLQSPLMAINAVVKSNEVALAGSIAGFFAGILSSAFVTSSAALFQNRLETEIKHFAPGTNVTSITDAGLSDLRTVLGGERLKHVLMGYDHAVDQTMYFPVALTCLSIVGALMTDWTSVKKKQQ